MKRDSDLAGFDRAMADLEASVTAVAAAVVRASASDLAAEAEHLFGDEAEVSVEADAGGHIVHVGGREPVLREFGTRTRAATPWLDDALLRTAARLSRRGSR